MLAVNANASRPGMTMMVDVQINSILKILGGMGREHGRVTIILFLKELREQMSSPIIASTAGLTMRRLSEKVHK